MRFEWHCELESCQKRQSSRRFIASRPSTPRKPTSTTMRTLLVTGAAGFIGSNFVRMLLNRGEQVKLIAFDKLTYAGNLANLQDLLDKHPDKLVFIRGDIC